MIWCTSWVLNCDKEVPSRRSWTSFGDRAVPKILHFLFFFSLINLDLAKAQYQKYCLDLDVAMEWYQTDLVDLDLAMEWYQTDLVDLDLVTEQYYWIFYVLLITRFFIRLDFLRTKSQPC